MRRLLLACLAVLPALAAHGASERVWSPALLSGAEQGELASRHTGRSYRIFMSRPQGEAPPAGYPVLYVLDGNALFPLLALQAQAMGGRAAAQGLEEVLVVGIGYPIEGMFDVRARAEDYTPPADDLSDTGDRRGDKQGGAAHFLDFIEDELKPLVEARYPVDRQRQTLFGHSYGGLFTLYALFERPESFQGYIAASPSIWWNKRHILGERHRLEAHARRQPLNARLYLSMGEQEQPAPGSVEDSPRQRQVALWRMVDNVRELAAALQPLAAHGLRSELHVLPGETHGSNALLTSIRALDFALGR